MGEDKANSDQSRRLLVRLQFPTNGPMAVEVNVESNFLERVWKLMLICEKIRRTMHGRARVIIEDAPCYFVSIMSEAPIERLLSMARLDEWHQLQCLWIPDNLFFG